MSCNGYSEKGERQPVDDLVNVSTITPLMSGVVYIVTAIVDDSSGVPNHDLTTYEVRKSKYFRRFYTKKMTSRFTSVSLKADSHPSEPPSR